MEQGKLAEALAFGAVLLLLALIVNLSARLVTAVLPEQDLERK